MTAEIDEYVSATVEHNELRIILQSGRKIRVECTIPMSGVLRMRINPSASEPGPSMLLADIPCEPAILEITPAGVSITGPGVSALWGEGQQFTCGEFARLPHPHSSGVPFSAGKLHTHPGQPAGWVETIQLGPDVALFGGGESFQGPNLRGRNRILRNVEEDRAAGQDSAYLNVPFIWSDAGWGLFVNTGATMNCDLGATHSEVSRLDIEGEELDLFLITGDAPTIMRRYLNLTGRPRRLPDWAFGVWMSRSSYFTADEVIEVVDELHSADCPVDVVHVDEWLSESVLSRSAWTTPPDRQRFPAGWVDELTKRGVRLSLWHNPYLNRDTSVGEFAAEHGYLIRDVHGSPLPTDDNPSTFPVDFTNDQARRWWTERLASSLTEEGNAAVLADFGEEIPPNGVMADELRGRQIRNSYGLAYQHAVWSAGQAAHPDNFVAISRSGTSGSQRFGAHWTGDMPSTWIGLVSSLRAMLSMSLSGFALVTHDAGGYWTPASYAQAEKLRATMTPGQVWADVEPELYARWMQFAALSPIMRAHGVGRREPTAYPEPAKTVAIEACKLRKRIQHYVISVAEEAAATGIPMIRPMVLAYPGDRSGRDADLQYLFGADVLVAPILQAGGRCQVWIPAGEWLPLWGLKPLHGPQWTTVQCELNQFPVFVRAGSTLAKTLG